MRNLILPVARTLALLAAAACLPAAGVRAQAPSFANPVVRSRDAADPWLVYHEGYYYFTATLDPSGGVWLWRSRTLAGLDAGEKIKIYDAPAAGARSRQIWAPELHLLNGRWYVYFTASDGVDENHRLYVLESRGRDPRGPYALKARLYDPAHDGWAIDPTVLRAGDGRLYGLWVAHVPGNGNGIRIARLRNPWTVAGEGRVIAQADYDWERVRYPINEGPVALARGGRLFVVYSASDTGTPDYALGLLTHNGGDLLDPRSWSKHPRPVFATYAGADGVVYGPGHNGFFKSPDGREDWIVYHGKETSEYTYAGRTARAQRFTWNPDGTPDFGRPVPRGVSLRAPSGEGRAAPSGGREAAGRTPAPRARAFVNPVFDHDLPDPTVIRASDGWFYVYATQGPVAGSVHNIQAARSRDLRSWERLPDALPTKPAWASTTQNFWAPDVRQRGRTFFMYFSAMLDPVRAEQFKKENEAEGSKEDVFCLGVATAESPGGPFRDGGEPLKCGLSFVNIDPMAFDDPRTGKKLLYWGSGFQPIRVQELADDRLRFKPGAEAVELVRADKGVPYQTLVEGPWVVERGGWYYLFYSGENCCHGPLQEIRYAVMVARSRSATGPFETLARATGAVDSVILRRGRRWIGPGHNSVVTDDAGQDWIAYHAIDVNRPHLEAGAGGDRAVRRVMLLDRLVWRGGWPRVAGGTPSEAAVRAPVVR